MSFRPRRLLRLALWCTALGLLVSSHSLAGSWTRANDLARKFPDFAAQKRQLTEIAVVVDVAEFEVGGGRATWVYVDDSRELAQKVEDELVAALAAKGYAAKPMPVLSVGHGADTGETCRVSSSWAKHDLRTKDVPLTAPPFYVDSTLNATAELVSAWRSMAQETRRVRSKPRTIPGTAVLREVLGTDYALMAVGLGTRNVVYRPVPTGGQFGGVVSHPDPSPYPGSRVQIALVDCRDGTVLWADGTTDFRAFSRERMDDIARRFVAQMP